MCQVDLDRVRALDVDLGGWDLQIADVVAGAFPAQTAAPEEQDAVRAYRPVRVVAIGDRGQPGWHQVDGADVDPPELAAPSVPGRRGR